MQEIIDGVIIKWNKKEETLKKMAQWLFDLMLTKTDKELGIKANELSSRY